MHVLPHRVEQPQRRLAVGRQVVGCTKNAILTGATVISDDIGKKLESATLDDLGTAGKIVSTKDETTVVEFRANRTGYVALYAAFSDGTIAPVFPARHSC